MAKVTRGAGTAGIKSGDVKKIKKGSKRNKTLWQTLSTKCSY